MNKDEILFEVCDILKINSINYWICHGTLLGIVRENRILPWDNDIDIGVWAHEVSKNDIIKIFKSLGFSIEPTNDKDQSIHLIKNGKDKVDINFYEIIGNTAVVRWMIKKKNFYNKFKIKIAEGLIKNRLELSHSVQLKSFLGNAVWYIGSIMSHFMFKNYIDNLVTKVREESYIYTGYSYPIELMEIVEFNFKGKTIHLPQHKEKILELTYGEKWEIPNKNYIWEDEAKNLYV